MENLDDREIILKFKQVYYEGELSHWVATMEFDGEQVYEENGVDLRDAGNRIYGHIWDSDSVIPNTYKYRALPNPFKRDPKENG